MNGVTARRCESSD